MAPLRKQAPINLSETNLAGIGSELEKEVKLHAAQTEAAWKDVGKTVGLRVWRIEKFQVKEVPKDSIGSFYTGDSYIALNTYKKPDDDKLYHDVHFWLGLETTQDEAGTAAYKTVELDDCGFPVQHREVQGFESSLFLSYFKFFTCLEGGIDSGFNKVKPGEYVPRLFQVSGNKGKSLVVRQVLMSCNSLNEGDVFIYDGGIEIYQWNGSKSSGQEKHKSMEFSRALAGSRKGAKVQVFEQDDRDADIFFEKIGGKGSIAPATETISPTVTNKVLLHVSDASGPIKVEVVAKNEAIHKGLLKSDDVFVLDTGLEIFVWVGKGASPTEKKEALNVAMKYLIENNRPPTTRISRVLEGGDNQEFFCFMN